MFTEVPKIIFVTALPGHVLRVGFEGGHWRTYDMSRWLTRPPFDLLESPALFKAVNVDPGGWGVSWNDDLDVAAYELWTHGVPVSAQSENASRQMMVNEPNDGEYKA